MSVDTAAKEERKRRRREEKEEKRKSSKGRKLRDRQQHSREASAETSVDVQKYGSNGTLDHTTLQASITSSPFYEQTFSLYLPLSPIAQAKPVSGLCAEHLSPLLLTYYPPFRGAVVSYSNPHLISRPNYLKHNIQESEAFSRPINEYPASFSWLAADFLLFKPQPGDLLEGFINLQNEDIIGLVCYNFFSASIERARIPKDWAFVSHGLRYERKKGSKHSSAKDGSIDAQDMSDIHDAESYFRDGNGNRVEGVIQFTVNTVEASRSVFKEHNYLTIRGTLLSPSEEEKLLEKNLRARGYCVQEVSSRDEGNLENQSDSHGDDDSIEVD